MDKKIITIGGSPHKCGYSAKMLRCFMELLETFSVEHSLSVHNYNAFECSFAPCIDCRECCKSEGCINNDMDEFFSDFETADGIVFSTPIYNMSFPAPLKVIIDRMQRYYNARFSLGKRPPILKRRPAALLMSAGNPDEKGDTAIKQLCRIFTVTNCELVCRTICAGTDSINSGEFPTLEVYNEVFQCVNKFSSNLLL